jgi:hypothetical protein
MKQADVLKELAEAAERFMNKAPKQARLEAERAALIDAITRAQLVLSVHDGKTKQEEHHSSTEQDRTEGAALLRSLPGSRAMSQAQKQIMERKSRPNGKRGRL